MERVAGPPAPAASPRLSIQDGRPAALDPSVPEVPAQGAAPQWPRRRRRGLGLATLFASHDLNVVRLLTDRVAVIYLGNIIPMAPSSSVVRQPAHPYTRTRVTAIPRHGLRLRLRLHGGMQNTIDLPPQVWRFVSRCFDIDDRCRREAGAAWRGPRPADKPPGRPPGRRPRDAGPERSRLKVAD